ncbi:Ketosteroid isomerase-related protein [Mucilaginibacter mallensis]|uniref:Ketosteroid isomerase-related protein n=1 Tax=Mucilaginibacter mallensis TaxID=652787 RepID=A0A1H1RCS8_MUCMA|nr:PhzA/PhzB family protein [Mucilaginibacter mallensis]SDS33564.1 Ketosteroid isomerase-related protein [Mucilaginibacter mallensis]
MENKIVQQIKNLFAGADERNWQKVEATMNDIVLLDYSSMTGIAATNLSPNYITTAWAAFLPGFDRTNHNLSGFIVKINGNDAAAHYPGKADHFLNHEIWVVKGTYDTKLKLVNRNWLITEHKFNFTQQSGNINLPALATQKMQKQVLIEQNRKMVDNFFVALETPKFEMLKELFAINGKQLNPYSPEGFPKSFDGAEGIYKQYSGLVETFGQMRFPREIFATEDPNFFFVKFRGKIEIKSGGKYENDYLGTFKLKDNKIIEYTEYFNQLVMAKAFGIAL